MMRVSDLKKNSERFSMTIEAERHQQDIFVASVAGAADDAALQRIAQREHAGRYDQASAIRDRSRTGR
jgi:hypothetical protein